jgi:acyl-CoA synthetase (AMP-forming)/AMP-acid ligase II
MPSSSADLSRLNDGAVRRGRTHTVSSLIAGAAERHPASPALLALGRAPMSHGELWQQCEEIGAELRARGHGPHARVAVALPAGPEMAAAYLAVVTHACCVPLNPDAQASELRRWFAATRVTCLLAERGGAAAARQVALERDLPIIEIVADAHAPAGRLRLTHAGAATAASAPECQPPDIGLIIQTSGTTGEPKVVELTQEALVASALSLVQAYEMTASDCTINVRPMYHVASLIVNTLAPLASGGRVAYAPGFDGQALFDWMAEFRPTWFSGVTTMYQWWLAHEQDYRRKLGDHRFRFLRAGSAAMPPAIMRRVEALTGAPLIEGYGMSERTPIAVNPLPPGRRKPGTVGRPRGVELALFDADGQPVKAGRIGEIAIRAPGVRCEPVGDHGAWFRTGDCGRFDEDGYLVITGRLKEMINRGGQKIAPREVEDQLLEHAAVAQAAAFGVVHPSLGEDVAAAVVAQAGASVDTAELRRFLLQRLAPYKVPATILVVDSMPLGPTGKVLRSALAQRCASPSEDPADPPSGVTEVHIASLFCEVLGRPHVGRHESFFALGGDSIAGTRVMSGIARDFGLDLPAHTLFACPSVAELAAQVDACARQPEDLAREIDALTDDEVAALLEREDARLPS